MRRRVQGVRPLRGRDHVRGQMRAQVLGRPPKGPGHPTEADAGRGPGGRAHVRGRGREAPLARGRGACVHLRWHAPWRPARGAAGGHVAMPRGGRRARACADTAHSWPSAPRNAGAVNLGRVGTAVVSLERPPRRAPQGGGRCLTGRRAWPWSEAGPLACLHLETHAETPGTAGGTCGPFGALLHGCASQTGNDVLNLVHGRGGAIHGCTGAILTEPSASRLAF
mmetsp:Transcript_14364/g.48661  ORF Transcript_14364/g.48661 Transcript_14364/m.48661 type:complete len:224 (+) Transcript_14364:211-882(+)